MPFHQVNAISAGSSFELFLPLGISSFSYRVGVGGGMLKDRENQSNRSLWVPVRTKVRTLLGSSLE